MECWADVKQADQTSASWLMATLSGCKTKELGRILVRLWAVLKSGIAAEHISKMPETTKLLSRLLRMDCIVCSEAAIPLFACMSCLLPSLTKDVLPEVDSSAKRKLATLRQRCSEWCRERLHAATVGLADESGLGGQGCGTSPSVELLYDCGWSHSDIISSIAEQASRTLVHSQNHQVGDISLQPMGMHAVGLALCISASTGGNWSNRLADAGQVLIERSFLHDGPSGYLQRQPIPLDECVLHMSGAQIGHLAVVHDDFLKNLVDTLITSLAASSCFPEQELRNHVEGFWQQVRGAPWALLAAEQALHGALVSLKCFHPNIAHALSIFARIKSASYFHLKKKLSSDPPHKSTWLWNEWTWYKEVDDGFSIGMHGGQDHLEECWPKACSIWHAEGPRVLLEAFGNIKVRILAPSLLNSITQRRTTARARA